MGYFTRPAKKKKAPLYNSHAKQHPVKFAAFNMVGVWTLCIPKVYLTDIRFPVAYPHWQDTYLILRLFARFDLVQLDQRLYVYRIHANMGSLLIESEAQLNKRAELNVAAIKDFENQQYPELSEHLTKADFKFLYAEKFAQYALLAKQANYPKLSKELMRKSRNHTLSFKLWKYYLRHLI